MSDGTTSNKTVKEILEEKVKLEIEMIQFLHTKIIEFQDKMEINVLDITVQLKPSDVMIREREIYSVVDADLGIDWEGTFYGIV